MTLTVPEVIRALLFSRARAAGSVECCGYLVAPYGSDVSDEAIACANVAVDRERTYAFGDAELFAFVRSFDSPRPARALYHSHPTGRAYFSPADRAIAATTRGPVYPVEHVVIADEDAAHFAWSDAAHDFVEVARWHATV